MLSTWAWTETSRAETGSSQMISRGFKAKALAMPIRCLWPPLNSWGVAGGDLPRHTDSLQEFSDSLLPVFLVANIVDDQGFGNQAADGHPGVQGREGILEYDLHIPAKLLELKLGKFGDLYHLSSFPAELNASGSGLIQPQDGAAGGSFAATAFPPQGPGFLLL